MLKNRLFTVFLGLYFMAYYSHVSATENLNSVRLQAMQVGTQVGALTLDTAEFARHRLNNVPGGTNLVEMSKQVGRQMTLDDALGFEPGIVIQEFFGNNDQPRLNIRGSGIQSNPQRRGIQLLQNGLPINLADGSYIIAQLDTRSADYVEVYRGANGLRYGAATLGGAVNLVSPTGYHVAGKKQLGVAGGHFDTYSSYASFGDVYGDTDFFVAATHNKSNGFRLQNKSERSHLSTNLGYRFNSNVESRLFFDVTSIDFDIPGPLNKAQLKRNPKKLSAGLVPFPPPGPPVAGSVNAGPNVLFDKPGRESTIMRLANKNTWLIDSGSITFSAFYQNVDDRFTFPMGVGVRDDNSHEWGGELLWAGKRSFFDSNHELELGLMFHFNQLERRYFNNLGGRPVYKFADNDLAAGNVTLFVQDHIDMTDKFTLVAALQLAYASRDIDDNFNNKTMRPRLMVNANNASRVTSFSAGDTSLDQDYRGVNPKLGALYSLNEETHVFANISRSFEPPTFDELLITKGGNPFRGPNDFKSVKLDEQTATTVEFGTRGSKGNTRWDVTFYRSWVDNEILTISDTFGISGKTINSPNVTIHQGLEAGLTLNVNDFLSVNTSYTWSDFFFNGGVFDNKQIAGVPEHFVHTEVMYQRKNGFYIGPNLKWMPDDTPTDHSNTTFQDSFALWGVKAGYDDPTGSWSVYIDGRNLTNKKYASSYLIRELAPTNPAATTFIPGSGINVTVGAKLYF